MITKAQIEKMKKLKGEARGMNLKSMFDYIYRKHGEAGVKKVEKKMAELGYPVKRSEVEPMSYHSMTKNALFVLAVKECFNMTAKDFKDMGGVMFQFNLFTKLFMKYFISLDMIFKQLQKIFRKHYTVGTIEMVEYSLKKKYAILRERGFKIDKNHLNIHLGYYTKASEMILKKPIISKVTKSVYGGDPYNEYIFRWK